MAQSNTDGSDRANLVESNSKDEHTADSDLIKATLEKLGIEAGIVIFRFPGDEDGSFRTVRLGHFYDSLAMVSKYCRLAKTRIMSDLDGIA